MALKAQGFSLRRIAAAVGLSHERVRYLLRKSGVNTALERTWKWHCQNCGKRVTFRAKLCRQCVYERGWILLLCNNCLRGFLRARKEYKKSMAANRHFFCSRRCYDESRHEYRQKTFYIKLTCSACGKVFHRRGSIHRRQLKEGCQRTFCSRKCYWARHESAAK